MFQFLFTFIQAVILDEKYGSFIKTVATGVITEVCSAIALIVFFGSLFGCYYITSSIYGKSKKAVTFIVEAILFLFVVSIFVYGIWTIFETVNNNMNIGSQNAPKTSANSYSFWNN
jgi:hypothetical protein